MSDQASRGRGRLFAFVENQGNIPAESGYRSKEIKSDSTPPKIAGRGQLIHEALRTVCF